MKDILFWICMTDTEHTTSSSNEEDNENYNAFRLYYILSNQNYCISIQLHS